MAIGFEYTTGRLILAASLFLAILGGRAACGQDEDFVDDAIAPPLPAVRKAEVQIQGLQVAQFNPDQIDQWVFNRLGGAAGASSRLNANLGLLIDDLERSCGLSELQKKKLSLAGMGDIKRFFDGVDELKRRYSGKGAQANWNNIWQEMQPLQLELTNGLFNDDSLFMKTVKHTLSADQMGRHDELMRHRRAARRRASVEMFVIQLDEALGLAGAQRGQLIELLLGETPPPEKYGQADYWYLMYQMTRLPEAKMTAILDGAQWRLLSRQFMQARGMEPWLRSNGIIAQGAKGAQAGAQVPIGVFAAPAVLPARVGGADVKK